MKGKKIATPRKKKKNIVINAVFCFLKINLIA